MALNAFLTIVATKQGMGQEVHYFTIVLKNANIASIDFQSPNNKHPDLMKFDPHEQIAMTYEEIRWTWVQGGIEHSDSWRENVGV